MFFNYIQSLRHKPIAVMEATAETGPKKVKAHRMFSP